MNSQMHNKLTFISQFLASLLFLPRINEKLKSYIIDYVLDTLQPVLIYIDHIDHTDPSECTDCHQLLPVKHILRECASCNQTTSVLFSY